MKASLSQKIIARAAGRRRVEPGEIAVVAVDRAMTYDPQAGALHRRFRERWGEGARLWDADRLILVADHFLDPDNPGHRQRRDELDRFAEAYGVRHHYPVGAPNHGVCHALLPEEGLVVPGELIAGTDSHSSTYGGFGAIGLNVGIDAMEGILAVGRHWMEVPRVVRITVEGQLAPDVGAKDVILRLCRDLTDTPLVFGAAVELDGEAIQALHPEEKLTLANMAAELGARWLIVPPNEAVCDWVRGLGVTGFDPLQPDPGASYAAVLRYRAEDFAPVLSLPGGPEKAVTLSELPETRFNEVFVGSCTGAKRFDIERLYEALAPMGGPAPGVRLMIVPATRRVRDWMFATPERRALFGAAGVTVAGDAGCNACAGLYGFIAGEEAVRLSTANRNYAGRMGAPGARVYLGSPALAARAAATGVLGG